VRVHAVVVTYNRKALLLECLEALARQSHPLERVVVVDNASTDGTDAALQGSGLGARLPLEYLRLERNGGGSEGFHYGVRAVLERDADWLWIMDDDCEPADDALQRLLEAPQAGDAATAVLAPVVRLPDGSVLPMHRGHIVSRPLRAPMEGLSPDRYADPAPECDFVSFVGPLVRMAAARAVGPPLREAFIRFEDLEYSARLRGQGRMWVVPAATVVHKEAAPLTGTDLASHFGDFSRRERFESLWKSVYGLRNTIFGGRRHRYVGAVAALTYVLVQLVRVLVFGQRRALSAYLVLLYAHDGWHGRFRNLVPADWPGLADVKWPAGYLNAHALSYRVDVAAAPQPVTPGRTAGAVPTPVE
jgi:rhamnopyranosyl-N-acetylglucosaminyl-diphospho-decaprenol beta-1,3/1,4-galactofuranosyltransferase